MLITDLISTCVCTVMTLTLRLHLCIKVTIRCKSLGNSNSAFKLGNLKLLRNTEMALSEVLLYYKVLPIFTSRYSAKTNLSS